MPARGVSCRCPRAYEGDVPVYREPVEHVRIAPLYPREAEALKRLRLPRWQPAEAQQRVHRLLPLPLGEIREDRPDRSDLGLA